MDLHYLDAPLLKEDAVAPNGPIKVSASSAREDNRALHGIIGGSAESVWKPAATTDTEYLQFEFPRNHVISTVEMRGELAPSNHLGARKGGSGSVLHCCSPWYTYCWDGLADKVVSVYNTYCRTFYGSEAVCKDPNMNGGIHVSYRGCGLLMISWIVRCWW